MILFKIVGQKRPKKNCPFNNLLKKNRLLNKLLKNRPLNESSMDLHLAIVLLIVFTLLCSYYLFHNPPEINRGDSPLLLILIIFTYVCSFFFWYTSSFRRNLWRYVCMLCLLLSLFCFVQGCRFYQFWFFRRRLGREEITWCSCVITLACFLLSVRFYVFCLKLKVFV